MKMKAEQFLRRTATVLAVGLLSGAGLAGLAGSAAGGNAPGSAVPAPAARAGLPLAFEANRGQTDARVRYLARAAGHTVFFTGDEAVMVVNPPAAAAHRTPHSVPPAPRQGLRLRLVDGNPAAKVRGVG